MKTDWDSITQYLLQQSTTPHKAWPLGSSSKVSATTLPFSLPLGILASLLSLEHISLRAFACPAPSALNAPSLHGPVAPRLRYPSSKRVPDPQLKTVHPSMSLFPLLCSVFLHVVSHSLTMNYTCFFIVCLPLQSKPHEGRAVTYLVHYYGSCPGSVPGTGSGLSRS